MMKTEVPWTTNRHGEVNGVTLHDNRMTSYAFSAKESFVFDTRTEQGELVSCEFRGIHDIYVELHEGAIILQVDVWKLKDAPQDQWHVRDSAWNELYKGITDKVEDRKKWAAHQVEKNPDASLVHISMSYPGVVVIICDSVHFYKAQAAEKTA
jgi:hypothetical protein